MSISNILGTHVLSNAWMNTDNDPATNAPGHAGLSQADIFTIAANAGSDVVRVPLSLRDAVKNADGSFQLPTWQIDGVIRLVESLVPATTVLLIEHNMEVVMDLATRITVLNFGQVLATGTPAAIRANPLVQEAYLGA